MRRDRLRQNLSQQTGAQRAGVSRLTVTRLEADGSATLATLLSVRMAPRRTADLDLLHQPRHCQTIEQFLEDAEPERQRGRR